MYTLKTGSGFDSAHFLKGYNGKCSNIHGHHWRVEIVVGKIDLNTDEQTRGMVVDFSDLKKDNCNMIVGFQRAGEQVFLIDSDYKKVFSELLT